MIKKLFTHSLIYSLAPQAPKIAALLLMPIITRHVTAADYGIYGIITSYLFFVTALRDLGFGVVFVNTFYKHETRWPLLWRMFHGHLIIWSMFYAVLMLVLLFIAVPSIAMHNFWKIGLLTIIPAVVFENSNTIGNYYYRFKQKPLLVATVSILTGVTAILVTYYCIVHLQLGYMGWFIATFCSSLVAFLFYLYPIYFKLKLLPIIRFRRKFIMPYLKVALPMVPHNYSSYLLNSSDRVIMDLYKVKIDQIGLYNIAYTFGNYMEAVGEAVGMAVGPFYSKLYTAKGEKALKDEQRLTFFLMTLFLLGTFTLSLWLKEIFYVLIKDTQLRSAYGLAVFIVMGYAYRPMYWSAGIKLSIHEKTSLLWKISFVAGLLNVVLNVAFVPLYGINAAALSTLLSLMYIGFSGYYFKAYKKLEGFNHYPLAWLMGIVALTITAYLLKDTGIYVKSAITILILGGCLLLAKSNYRMLKEIDV